MNTYSTSEIAKMIGVHPNTVRLYEAWGLIPRAERKANGYRVFTEFHVRQMRLARVALQTEVLQGGLRKKIVEAVKCSAQGELDRALCLTEEYRTQIRQEIIRAQEAVRAAEGLLAGEGPKEPLCMKRREVSEHLGISMDTLRSWELNGLLRVRRMRNGYRVYTGEDIDRLKMIRALRCANYSLEAILRMLNARKRDPQASLARALNHPHENEDIVSVCDRLLSSLAAAERNAETAAAMLVDMKGRMPGADA